MEAKTTKEQISVSFIINGTEEIETFRDILSLAFWLSKAESPQEGMATGLLSAIREARGGERLSRGLLELAWDFIDGGLLDTYAKRLKGDSYTGEGDTY